jgi:hypothetical protein
MSAKDSPAALAAKASLIRTALAYADAYRRASAVRLALYAEKREIKPDEAIVLAAEQRADHELKDAAVRLGAASADRAEATG